jgi:hypothetical protein
MLLANKEQTKFCPEIVIVPIHQPKTVIAL